MASKIFYDCGCMEQGDQFFDCGKHAKVPPGEPPADAQPATEFDAAAEARKLLKRFNEHDRTETRVELLEALLRRAVASSGLQPPAAQPDTEGWQPITDEQKDGYRYLVPVPGADGPYFVAVVRWDEDEESEGGQCWRKDDDERIGFEPTLFMRLPFPEVYGRSSQAAALCFTVSIDQSLQPPAAVVQPATEAERRVKLARAFAMEYFTGHDRPLIDGEQKRFDQFVTVLLAYGAQAFMNPPAAVVQPAETYEQYHRRVVDAIRKRLLARWPPIDADDRRDMEQNVSFFDRECDYHDEFAEGLDPEEIADDEIDAAR